MTTRFRMTGCTRRQVTIEQPFRDGQIQHLPVALRDSCEPVQSSWLSPHSSRLLPSPLPRNPSPPPTSCRGARHNLRHLYRRSFADGGVTFRFKAAKAGEVKVSGQFGPETAMTKDDQGVWSATVRPAPAGVHEYRFLVDGLSVIDPQNSAVKPQRWPGVSILHVPASPAAPWDLQDIPHGTIHEHTYNSKALGKWRRIFVYTPPGAASAGRLPVLYLAHGYSDNEATWTVHGKAHWIMDSLIASKRPCP